MVNLAPLKQFTGCDNLHDEILAWYDGYSWDGENRVINPFSLLSFFDRKRFSSFWFASGTPKFLMDLIKKRPAGYTNLNNLRISELALDSFDLRRMEAESLLFQSGYLTVKETLQGTGAPVYLMDMPNYEVREAFNMHIFAAFTETGSIEAESAYMRIKESLDVGDLQGMLQTLRGLFASIPYQLHMKHEYYYHSIFYAMLNLLGFDIAAEVSVSGGRIDATLELSDKAYVMEFKYVDCPADVSPDARQETVEKALDDGMQQIRDKGYADKYAGSGKAVTLAAFAFLGRDDIEMRVETG